MGVQKGGRGRAPKKAKAKKAPVPRMGATKRRGPTRGKPRAPLAGTLRVSPRGRGTVETPEGTFSVPGRRLGEAMHGDTVTLRMLGTWRGPVPEAAVTGVVERGVSTFAAYFYDEGSFRVLCPLDERILHDFVMDPEDASAQRLGAADGQVVVARVTRYPSRKAPGVATVERIIGDDEERDVPIEAIIASHDLPVAFPEAALAEARALVLDVDAALAEPLRRDIRTRFVATVDPVDARDFDDALSVEGLEDGGWLLGVHIADVSAYVPWGSAIDMAARERTTSTYLADRVLPMLPEELSCDLCSLVPNEDRLAMTVDLTLDAAGRTVAAEVYPSVIRSKARMTYDEVDALLSGAAPDRTVCGVALAGFFAQLDRIRTLRAKLRRARGSIEFVSSEVKVVLDESRRPTGVRVRVPTAATTLVEEAMLAANEAVAEKVGKAGVPGVYRVHEAPDADRLAALVPLLEELGCLEGPLKARLVAGDPHALQAVLDAVAGEPEEELVSAMLLRAMKRATYEPRDLGHYGLGAEAYCHFTSPIRRYPDLVMHRSLKALLAPRAKAAYRREVEDALPLLCRHASHMEREAAAAAAESQAVKMAEYMERFVGQAFAGTVVTVAPFGVFVRLDETHAEGLLAVRDLGEGWWDFDERRRELVHAGDERRLRLGQRLEVRVRSCDVLRGRIDFALPRAEADEASI